MSASRDKMVLVEKKSGSRKRLPLRYTALAPSVINIDISLRGKKLSAANKKGMCLKTYKSRAGETCRESARKKAVKLLNSLSALHSLLSST